MFRELEVLSEKVRSIDNYKSFKDEFGAKFVTQFVDIDYWEALDVITKDTRHDNKEEILNIYNRFCEAYKEEMKIGSIELEEIAKQYREEVKLDKLTARLNVNKSLVRTGLLPIFSDFEYSGDTWLGLFIHEKQMLETYIKLSGSYPEELLVRWTYSIIAQIAKEHGRSIYDIVKFIPDEEYMELWDSYEVWHTQSIEYAASLETEYLNPIPKGKLMKPKGLPSVTDWGRVFGEIFIASELKPLEFKHLIQDNEEVMFEIERVRTGFWYLAPYYLYDCLKEGKVL